MIRAAVMSSTETLDRAREMLKQSNKVANDAVMELRYHMDHAYTQLQTTQEFTAKMLSEMNKRLTEYATLTIEALEDLQKRLDES